MSVIAYVNHEKPALTDSLTCKAGSVADRETGDARSTDTRVNEQERNVTIKSSRVLLLSELQERVPNLIVNKVDRCISEWQMAPEDVHGRLRGMGESVKVIIATYNDALMEECSVTIKSTGVLSFLELQERVIPTPFVNRV